MAQGGNKVVVFNTENSFSGFFAKYFNLKLSDIVQSNEISLEVETGISISQIPNITMNSSIASCTAYYKLNGINVAPFIITEKLGLGEVTYVILPSKIMAALDKPLVQFKSIFYEIINNQKNPTEKVQYSLGSLGSYDTLEGSINLSGTITIESELFSCINSINSSVVSIKNQTNSWNLINVNIKSLYIYGPSQLVMNGESMKIQSDSASSYLSFSTNGANQSFFVELSDRACAFLTINTSKGESDFQINGDSSILIGGIPK